MNSPLISVIVPIYKVEQYLRRCVDSILSQTYKNLEIILVDDGSPDDCGRICDIYAEQDTRVRVIHKKNGGLSDARNAGLDIMTGEFVTCIDSDDFVSNWYVENLYTAVQELDCDISTCQFIEYYETDPIPVYGEVEVANIEKLSRVEAYKRMLYQDRFEVSAWGKLYRSSYFNGVRYPFGKLYEDILTTYKLMEQTDRIAVLPCKDYYYFQRNDSIAQSSFHVKKMDGLYQMKELCQLMSEHYPELRAAAECRYFSATCNILFLVKEGYETEKNFMWKEIKKYRKSVLMNSEGRKKARIGAVVSYFGYSAMKKLFHIVSRW